MRGFKKALGQNFFSNANLANQICEVIKDSNPKGILEIGPGDGYFTQRFSNFCSNVVAIEKDTTLVPSLIAKLQNVNIINADFFDVNITELQLGLNPVVFGSLPYNIARLIIKFLLEHTSFNTFFFILQKEVAQKYALESKSSLQFITTKLFVDSKIIYNISSGSFIPRPKVDSAFIQMKRNENIKDINKEKFLNLVKLAFTAPRKTLRNNLKPILQNLDDNAYLNMRAEDLSFNDFIHLYHCAK